VTEKNGLIKALKTLDLNFYLKFYSEGGSVAN
jgi:hypothetical protein